MATNYGVHNPNDDSYYYCCNNDCACQDPSPTQKPAVYGTNTPHKTTCIQSDTAQRQELQVETRITEFVDTYNNRT